MVPVSVSVPLPFFSNSPLPVIGPANVVDELLPPAKSLEVPSLSAPVPDAAMDPTSSL